MGFAGAILSLFNANKENSIVGAKVIECGNRYTYIGGSVYSIIQNVTKNNDMLYCDVANVELLRQSSNCFCLYAIPHSVQLKEGDVQSIKRQLSEELMKINNITSVDDFNKRFRIDIVNRQIMVRLI